MKTITQTFVRFAQIFMTIILIAGFSALAMTGCKPKKEQVVVPTPVPTPVPVLGNIIFVQSGHLAELNLANSQITPLTSGKSTEWFPVASPKGDQVLYWSNADTGVYNLWILNLTNSQRTQLTFNDVNGLSSANQNLLINDSASWSSDEKVVIYSQDGAIWAIDADGYNPRTIVSGHHALCPSFSPDGKSVLYLSNFNDAVYNLYVLNQSDKTTKQITNYTDWNVGSPNYSVDGSKILFNLYRGDETQIYTIKNDGSEPLNLTNNIKSLSPRFGQSDKKVFYAAYGQGQDSTLNIYVMSSNGTDVKQITTSGGASPSWATSLTTVSTPLTTPTHAILPISKAKK